MKDPEILEYDEAELRRLHAAVKDPNFRIFTDRDTITVFNNELFVRGTDIQEIFAQLGVDEATHAFYLGRELMKAKLAITLGKTYRQEGALSWGYLTPPDDVKSEHVKLTQRRRRDERRRRAAGRGTMSTGYARWSSTWRGGEPVEVVRPLPGSSLPPVPRQRHRRHRCAERRPPARPVLVPVGGPGARRPQQGPRRPSSARTGQPWTRLEAIRSRPSRELLRPFAATPVSGAAAVPGRRRRLHRLRLRRGARAAARGPVSTISPFPTSCSGSTTG